MLVTLLRLQELADCPILRQTNPVHTLTNPVHTLTPYCFKIHFNIIFPSAPNYYKCSYSITYCGVKHVLVCLVELLGIREESVILYLWGMNPLAYSAIQYFYIEICLLGLGEWCTTTFGAGW